MDFETATELFYNNEKYQEQFDYWKIDYAIATINTWLDDMEEIADEEE